MSHHLLCRLKCPPTPDRDKERNSSVCFHTTCAKHSLKTTRNSHVCVKGCETPLVLLIWKGPHKRKPNAVSLFARRPSSTAFSRRFQCIDVHCWQVASNYLRKMVFMRSIKRRPLGELQDERDQRWTRNSACWTVTFHSPTWLVFGDGGVYGWGYLSLSL